MTASYFKQVMKLFGRKDRYAGKDAIAPESDWETLLISGIVVAVLIAVGSAYMFFEINNEHIFEKKSPSSPPEIIIDRARVENVIKNFEEKARRFDELSRQAPKATDPSSATPVR